MVTYMGDPGEMPAEAQWYIYKQKENNGFDQNDGELPNPKHTLYSLIGALLLPHCNGTVLLVGGAITAPPRLRSDGIV